MPPIFLVMIGGAMGAGARHLVGIGMFTRFGAGFPYATLSVNILGGLLMGLLVGVLARTGATEGWRLLLGVGVLGGFTTFSAFSLDVVLIAERGASMLALAYVLASMIGSILALFAGLSLIRAVG